MNEQIKTELTKIAKKVNVSHLNHEIINSVLNGIFAYRNKEDYKNFLSHRFGDKIKDDEIALILGETLDFYKTNDISLLKEHISLQNGQTVSYDIKEKIGAAFNYFMKEVIIENETKADSDKTDDVKNNNTIENNTSKRETDISTDGNIRRINISNKKSIESGLTNHEGFAREQVKAQTTVIDSETQEKIDRNVQKRDSAIREEEEREKAKKELEMLRAAKNNNREEAKEINNKIADAEFVLSDQRLSDTITRDAKKARMQNLESKEEQEKATLQAIENGLKLDILLFDLNIIGNNQHLQEIEDVPEHEKKNFLIDKNALQNVNKIYEDRIKAISGLAVSAKNSKMSSTNVIMSVKEFEENGKLPEKGTAETNHFHYDYYKRGGSVKNLASRLSTVSKTFSKEKGTLVHDPQKIQQMANKFFGGDISKFNRVVELADKNVEIEYNLNKEYGRLETGGNPSKAKRMSDKDLVELETLLQEMSEKSFERAQQRFQVAKDDNL